MKPVSSTEDLGIKIGTPTEVQWIEILKAQETSLISNKINQEIAEMLIERAKKRIKEEKGKL